MAKRRKRGPRVPEALLRVYGSLVQTLEAAILSLLPPPPACLCECACGGSRCLGCCSSDFLLRKDDPPDYRMLLTHGFCVVSRDAPPPPGVFISDNIPQRTLHVQAYQEVNARHVPSIWYSPVSFASEKRNSLARAVCLHLCSEEKHSQYQKLLSLLRSRIAQYGSFADSLSHLRYAVDESHSSCFAKIKF